MTDPILASLLASAIVLSAGELIAFVAKSELPRRAVARVTAFRLVPILLLTAGLLHPWPAKVVVAAGALVLLVAALVRRPRSLFSDGPPLTPNVADRAR